MPRRPTLVPVVLVLLALVACTPPPPGPTLAPGLVGAPPGEPTTSVAPLLAGSGYQQSEYFLTGTASAYRSIGPWGIDGHWDKRVSEPDVPFTTRLLVARPADPARFNGTVWVEWLNDTGQFDLAISILQARHHIVASGGAWVGVSAQQVGVSALRLGSPRYASLRLPSDALSYDVFTAAARSVRAHAELFGGVAPERLVGVGYSQSAVRLATYINAWAQDDPAFDGFVVQGRFTAGAPVGEGIMLTTATRIRDDAARPVLQLQTQSEVGMNLEALFPGVGTWEAVRQPDAGNVHTWEVPGAAHVDRFALSGGDASAAPAVTEGPCGVPINSFPLRYATAAAFESVERWIELGQRPASVPPITTVRGRIVLDADGNALGGLRLPDIDVPIASYDTNVDFANPICALFGSSFRFDPASLHARYGSTDGYVAAYTQRADAAVAAGIMRPADRDAAIADARTVTIPS